MTATQISTRSHRAFDVHGMPAAGGADLRLVNDWNEAQTRFDEPDPTSARGHCGPDTQPGPAAGGTNSRNGSAAIVDTTPSQAPLADPFLALAADVLDDLEQNRKANANRLGHLTRLEADEDGVVRGLGLDERHPDVAMLVAVIDSLKAVEHQAVLNLQRIMRRHPLGAWVQSEACRGVGLKIAARLLAAIGDPYLNMQTGEPRTVGQLWAYCGHGDPTRRKRKGMSQADLFAMGNPVAKMRVYLIAECCLKAGGDFAEVYRARRAVTEDRVHAADCVRCGPAGHPAKAGSPWSKAHQHADALRIVGKEFLRQLWVESKRLHEC